MLNLDDYCFNQHGFEVCRKQLESEYMENVKRQVSLTHQKLNSAGIRQLEKKFSSIQDIAQHTRILAIAERALGNKASLVRGLFFDKTPDRNWLVGWHQDKTVSVNRKFSHYEWRAWSLKEGVYHVQPPLEVLEKMVTLRIHIDHCNLNSGCLKIIPTSHQNGILQSSQVKEVVASSTVVDCEVNAGDILVMRPHLLHSSAKALVPSHRRIVHLEFSSYDLPANISWA